MRLPIRIGKICATVLVLGMAGCAASQSAGQLIRHPLPNSTFPIASAVEVRGDLATVYLSGLVPPVLDATAGTDRAATYGADTKTQTVGTLRSIEKTLDGLGLTMGDVIKMQVFLVGDPARSGTSRSASRSHPRPILRTKSYKGFGFLCFGPDA